MSLILGTEYCKIDSNGRFKFPIAFKKQLGSNDCTFVIRQKFTGECLELWTESSFQEEMNELKKELNPRNTDDIRIMRQVTRVNVVPLDSNDRMLIPPERKSTIGDAKEIVLQANGSFIEIWERSAYDKMNEEEMKDLVSIVNKRFARKHELPSAGDAE